MKIDQMQSIGLCHVFSDELSDFSPKDPDMEKCLLCGRLWYKISHPRSWASVSDVAAIDALFCTPDHPIIALAMIHES